MKAILVIDIPDDLTMEDLEVYGEISSNRIDDGWVRELRKEDLKPMPAKNIWDKKDFADGWNACLERLEKNDRARVKNHR